MPFLIQRFRNSLGASPVNEETKADLLQSCDAYEALATTGQKAQWIKDMMLRLDEQVGEAVARRIMQDCGRHCIDQSVLEKARRLQRKSMNLDDLLDRLNQAHIGGGKLQRTGNVIHAAYDRCYCGSVSKSPQQIPLIYCHCSCGWYQQLFETLLEKPVQVQLLDSIAHGALICQFAIHI